jgi:hypothetical protein
LPRKLFCRTEKKPTVRQIVTAQKQHFKTATFLHFHAAGNKAEELEQYAAKICAIMR